MDRLVSHKTGHLQIPQKTTSSRRTLVASQQSTIAPWWSRLWTLIRKQCRRPTKDQLRWPVQAGIAGGLAFLLVGSIEPMGTFFGQAGLIGLVMIPIALEATAGGSLRRNVLYIAGVACLTMVGYGLFMLCTHNGTVLDKWYVFVGMSISATVLPIPVCILRYVYPSLTLGLALGLSIAENVLLGNLTLSHPDSAGSHTVKRILAVVVGAVVTIAVTHTILVKAARPTAANTLATILETMASVLDPLASMTTVQLHGVTSSSNLLLTSYPQLLASARILMQNPDPHSISSQQPPDTTTTTAAGTQQPISVAPSGMTPAASRATSLLEVLEPNKKECERMMNSINQCQKLLSAQKDLISAAAQEFSCRKPHRFPRQRYMPLLTEVRTLFFHISFLVYALNLSLSTVEYQLKLNNDSHTDGEEDQQHHHTTAAAAAAPVCVLPHSKTSPARRNQSNPHFGSNFRFDDVAVGPFVAANGHPLYDADVLGFGGYNLHEIARHIVSALKLIAGCLRERQRTSAAARQEVKEVCATVSSLNDQRRHQREKFADIVFRTLEADVTGIWNLHHESPLDWKSALFLDAKELRQMTLEQKKGYWEAYWLGRDRVSTVEQTLHTLQDSLLRLCDYVDNYIDVALVPDATVIAMIP